MTQDIEPWLVGVLQAPTAVYPNRSSVKGRACCIGFWFIYNAEHPGALVGVIAHSAAAISSLMSSWSHCNNNKKKKRSRKEQNRPTWRLSCGGKNLHGFKSDRLRSGDAGDQEMFPYRDNLHRIGIAFVKKLNKNRFMWIRFWFDSNSIVIRTNRLMKSSICTLM